MDKLIAGVRRFQLYELGRYQKIFRRVAQEGQSPHALFITCCDSRVHAELITQSQPGDLFVVKNVGNIVPPAHLVSSSNSTAAAIEFAVEVLNVDHIVVCGHSGCGAMEALLRGPSNKTTMPHLADWLALAEPVRERMMQEYSHITDLTVRAVTAAQENVLYGIENLLTYPVVSNRVIAGTLHLHGWFFKIATAEMMIYDPTLQQFVGIESSE